ncbi:EAL domain-containing protein [Eubacteriaceae bacterium ES3]|nr:EAL domain-containing protein [Eubacteriaceae bacterium ES3]
MNNHRISDFFKLKILKKFEDDETIITLKILKNRIYAILSLLIVIFSGPVLFYGAYLFYQNGQHLFAFLEILVYLVISLSVFLPAIRVSVKKIILVMCTYFFSLILLFNTGPMGAGMISIIMAFVLSTTLLDKRQNIIFFIVNFLISVIITVFLYTGLLDDFAIAYYDSYWLINILTLQLVLLGLTIFHHMIYEGLEKQTKEIIKSKEELAASEENFRVLADTTVDVIWVYNIDLERFVYISPSITTFRGISVEEALEETLEETILPEFREPIREEIAKTLKEFKQNPTDPKCYINEVQQPNKDGGTIWIETASRYRYNKKGEIEIVSSSRNIMERKQKEAEIEYLDVHDPLTDLYNRKILMKRMLNEEPFSSVISINIDNFRVINEELGHKEGDRILRDIAIKIETAVNNRGTVYRAGGDEFVAVIKLTDEKGVFKVAEEINKAISTQFMSGKRLLFLTASLGISLGKKNAVLSETVREADAALYVAKKEKNRILLYQPSMEKRRSWEAIIEKELKTALENNEFEIVYQPIYDLKEDKFNHAEALLRWNHPEYGLISPVDFIPVAEKIRLIIPITNWIIKKVCFQSKIWQNVGLHDMVIGINISLLSFENRGTELMDAVENGIQEADIKPTSIKLEITESCLIRDTKELIKTFNQIKKIGVQLALDDFGTGYSSFGSLKDFPFDMIKLDRSLISNIEQDKREEQIARALITIIHSLNILVVAEGIETRQQFEILKNMNCDYIQGFYFSQPLMPDDLNSYCKKK